MGANNRLYPRVKIRWPVSILTNNNAVHGITRNISVNGAYIYYYKPHLDALPLLPKQRVGAIVKIPGRLPLMINAEVAWSDILNSDEQQTLLGVGLRFLELFYEDREFLHHAITERLAKK
ncbi:MAG TPA: PilZ domain-containing protein [Syntrophobacteria bacterium]|nr:PilZ domain-containing protein [Syntrophobacteria bacterium]